MTCSKNLFCTGILACGFLATQAQHLPKNASPEQVMGYQLQQQKQWVAKQLPKNSVLYNKNYTGYTNGVTVNFTKQPPLPPIGLPTNTKAGNESPVMNLWQQENHSNNNHVFMQQYLFADMIQYNKWQKDGWWKDPQKGIGASLIKSALQK